MRTTNTIIDRILQHRIVTHFLFWSSFLLIFTLLGALNTGTIKNHLINYLALLPAQMLAAYTLVYYQVPRLLLKKKYVQFGLSFILAVYVFAVVARLTIIYVAEPFIREDFVQESVLEVLSDPIYLFAVYFPGVYLIVFLMLTVKTIKERFEEKHQIEVLQKEKATTELKFLKAQIHPHFLFNTLNNLYALTLAKSDAAPEVVVKLSEILDYMLYQCNDPTIAIHKEVELIQNYLDLERLRYGQQLQVRFEHQIEQENTAIAPLLLLAFVENAFKHGVRGNPRPSLIEIDLSVKQQQLYFKVMNTKISIKVPKKSNLARNGLGLSNVKRQLVLHYPKQHQLNIQDTNTTYEVTLTINLNKKR